MPDYVYENPDTGEQITVWQSIHEDHTYEIDGVEFDRVYTVPHAAIDTQIDPYSEKDFREKAKGSTVGDLWDQSAELSEKRATKEGRDPVKSKYFEDYASTRKGVRHPKDPDRDKPSKDFTIE